MATLWSLGYEGHTSESFAATLRAANIDLLVDVRQRASSRKRGFSKGALREMLEANGLAYEHLPKLGAPSELRHEYYATKDVEAFHRGYRLHLDEQHASVMHLADLARRSHAAMMCVEQDMRVCHRIVLARELESQGIRVKALDPPAGWPPRKTRKSARQSWPPRSGP